MKISSWPLLFFPFPDLKISCSYATCSVNNLINIKRAILAAWNYCINLFIFISAWQAPSRKQLQIDSILLAEVSSQSSREIFMITQLTMCIDVHSSRLMLWICAHTQLLENQIKMENLKKKESEKDYFNRERTEEFLPSKTK